MTQTENAPTTDPTLRLEAKVDRLAAQVEQLVRAQQRQSELIDEATPIVRQAVEAAAGQLGELEARGAMGFARGTMRLMDTLIASYGEEDVDELGRNLVTILDTVRALTQPAVLALANEATEVLHHPEEVQPMGVFGLARASKDIEVQRGMAMLIELLRHLGRATEQLQEQRTESRRFKRRPSGEKAPERPVARRTPPPAPAPHVATTQASTAAKPPPPGADGLVEFDQAGFLVHPEQWSPELAQALANELGVGELGPRHWLIIDFARKETAASGASPNIRRLTTGSGMDTRELFELFKRAPGKTVARIAGTPRPVGCI